MDCCSAVIDKPESVVFVAEVFTIVSFAIEIKVKCFVWSVMLGSSNSFCLQGVSKTSQFVLNLYNMNIVYRNRCWCHNEVICLSIYLCVCVCVCVRARAGRNQFD